MKCDLKVAVNLDVSKVIYAFSALLLTLNQLGFL